MRAERLARHIVGGNDAPAALRGDARGRRIAARDRHRDRRTRLLIGFRHIADAELGNDRVLELHRPELAFEIVGRILRPDALDHADQFHRFALAHLAVAVAEQLEVREQPADADPEHEAAAAHGVELRDFGRDLHRVMARQADHRGAEGEILGARQQARHEHQRRGDRLRGRGKMLAEPQFVETERVGVERLLLVLGQRIGERAVRRMHRHHEQAKTHCLSSAAALRSPQRRDKLKSRTRSRMPHREMPPTQKARTGGTP